MKFAAIIVSHIKNTMHAYIHKVASLDHKIFDNTMKCTSSEANWDTVFPVFTRTKLPTRSNLYYNPTNFDISNKSHTSPNSVTYATYKILFYGSKTSITNIQRCI